MESSVFRDYLKKLNLFAFSTSSSALSTPKTTTAEKKTSTPEAVSTPAPTPIAPKAPEKPNTVSLFAADIVIEGSVFSDSDIRIEGTIHGDIECKGNIELSGSVTGNMTGQNILITGAKITGDITAAESLYTTDSEIVGNLFTQTADINSSVKGDITASRMLVIRKAASVKGNISAASISIEENALLDGSVCVYQENK
ncbi:MAG: polymer-forming cytoskeletal protein [Alistipes sp.]|nr:polymer-forming cytoskeletal protein [Alistipes sp.]